MARKTLRDDKGKEYEVELPDDDDDASDDDDEETIWLDAEDIEWLKRKRLEESESQRQASSSTSQRKKSGGKVVRIRATQPTSGTSESPPAQQKTRKRVLRLA